MITIDIIYLTLSTSIEIQKFIYESLFGFEKHAEMKSGHRWIRLQTRKLERSQNV